MNCHRCYDEVTHPMCPECLAVAVREGLHVDVGEWVEVEAEGTPCIICGHDIALCSYCASEDLLAEIEQKYPNLKEQAVEFFHMDLDKQGYTKNHWELV